MNLEDDMSVEKVGVTGTMVSYAYVCHRKLWLYSKGLNLENISGNVDVIKGKILHENRFQRESQKEVAFDTVKIDFLRFGDQVFVHEVKKSKRYEKAHIWQLKFYIYLLRKRGVNCGSGVIHYPASMRKVDVEWEEGDNASIEQVLKDIDLILRKPGPPPIQGKKMCSRCAYFDFCYV
ncbi:MAG: CRISPR-associated protein Cas4 [Syntrophomonadales bacterium]